MRECDILIFMEQHIERITAYVKQAMSDEATGHDWFHVERVVAMTQRLALEEGADEAVTLLAALLHDIGDIKLTGDASTLLGVPTTIMDEHGVSADVRDRVLAVISEISFAGKHTSPTTLEAQVVQDADRLDALGAIGIARCFAYGGHKGRVLWNPDEPPLSEFTDKQAYYNHQGSSLNHFDEKLFKLKDHFNTTTAKRIAAERDAFLHEFYIRFKDEWYGQR